MKIEVLLPLMGESVSEGTLEQWFKKPGDKIAKDDILYEVSTDKVDSEIPSPVSGVLTEIVVREGETPKIGSVLGYIETDAAYDGSPAPRAVPPAQEQEQEEKQETGEVERPEPEPVPAAEQVETPHVPRDTTYEPRTDDGDEKKRFYSPLVLRIAQEEDIPFSALKMLKGTGTGGRVTKKDILQNIAVLRRHDPHLSQIPHSGAQMFPSDFSLSSRNRPSQVRNAVTIREKPKIDFGADGISVVPMDAMRAKIAEHMMRSVRTSPHVTAVSEADITELVLYREKENIQFKAREGFSLNYTALIARALVLAIEDYPELNASIDGTNIIYRRAVNIGIAVALENGLIVPVVKNSDEKTLVGLVRGIYDVSTRARNKRLLPEEIMDSTITITNFGLFGNVLGTPLINQPNVAILGVGAIKKRPEVLGSTIAVRDMVYLTLGFDHRLIDGAAGGLFLSKIVEYLENFESLL